MKVTSQAFSDSGIIPQRYTCEGENINPPLNLTDLPEATKSLAIVVTDPDIPEQVKNSMDIEIFNHWIAFNIAPDTKQIEAGQSVGIQGENSSGNNGYTGPCPPAEYEPAEHRYIFRVYALDTELDLPIGTKKEALQEKMNSHVCAEAKLVGRYKKQNT
jgi:Raf kinase inhibitor-like YbhB/YbcL family protein